MLIAFLDEFGHIGPYVSRSHEQHRASPVFGLGGLILPHHQVRGFATWFYQLKNNILDSEIKKSKKHPATWEKKGNELLTTRNIKKYPNISTAVNRLINKIYRIDGRIVYYGREKYQPPESSNASGLYTTVLSHIIKQIDKYSIQRNTQFMMILDQHSDRLKLIAASTKTMFGKTGARCLIEPPFQVESHLYQTVQAADWIATIVGRILAHAVRTSEFPDWEWAPRLFKDRVDSTSTHSVLWRPRSAQLELPS